MVDHRSRSAEETEELGKKIASKLKKGMVIGLKGPVGAGKSVLTRGIARGLSISGPVTSPTYTLISQYTEGSLPLYHMDLYRIDSEEEFELIGAREYLYGDGVCIIEWFERVQSLLPDDHIVITVEILENGDRTIHFSREI